MEAATATTFLINVVRLAGIATTVLSAHIIFAPTTVLEIAATTVRTSTARNATLQVLHHLLYLCSTAQPTNSSSTLRCTNTRTNTT